MRNKKGQMKIQEMAFVLVAIMIFFAIISLLYFRFKVATLKEDVSLQRDDEAKELIRKIASTPEFSLSSKECESCIDMDKVMALKERRGYEGFWNLDYLMIEQLSIENKGECNRLNYPNCETVTIVNKTKDFGVAKSSFVALCRYEVKQQPYVKCELGKIYASGKNLES